MAWQLSAAFSETPQAPGEMVQVILTNPPLSLAKEYFYTRYGFESNIVFEARVRADIQINLDLLNAQYNRRQDQTNRFRGTGNTGKVGVENQ